MKRKVSVLIPCYNGERFLETCIRSLQQSTYADLEIIIVNDGSTDQSEALARRLAEQDERIRVFSQENAGVCAARNAAMAQATGDYIFFCDADDFVPPNAIELLLKEAEAYESDITAGWICYQRADLSEACPEESDQIRVLETKEQILQCGVLPLFDSVCGKLYRRELLNGLTFEVGRKINEDIYFNFLCLEKAKKVVRIARTTYKILYHSGSASRTGFSEKHYDILYFRDKRVSYLEQNYPHLKKLSAAVSLRHSISFMTKFVRSDASKQEKKKIKKEIWANRKGYSLLPKREKILFVAICCFYPVFRFRYSKRK